MAISTRCWKYLVLTFNILFAMSAVVLIMASGFFIFELFIYRHFIGSTAQYPAILLLMVSIVACAVAWIGWRTAKTMFQLHVVVSGVLILLIVATEFGVFVWALVVRSNIEIEIKSTMTDYFVTTHHIKEAPMVDLVRWDRLHVQMQCCGVSGHHDFTSTGRIPMSCCGQGPLDALNAPYTSDCSTLYKRGCGKPLLKYAEQYLLIIAATALLASVLQSTGIFCTFILARGKTKDRPVANNSIIIRDSIAADDTLLSAPSAPAPTLPKFR